jgi:hypothetical protein
MVPQGDFWKMPSFGEFFDNRTSLKVDIMNLKKEGYNASLSPGRERLS